MSPLLRKIGVSEGGAWSTGGIRPTIHRTALSDPMNIKDFSRSRPDALSGMHHRMPLAVNG